MSKQSKYQSNKDDADGMEGLEKLANRLSTDLRKNVRTLGMKLQSLFLLLINIWLTACIFH